MMKLADYDFDHHFIHRIENGERFVTNMELIAIAKILKATVYELIHNNIVVIDIFLFI